MVDFTDNELASDNQLKYQFEKLRIIGLDNQYYLERLFSYPEGVWFMPTNETHQDYEICWELHKRNLIQKMNEPIWINSGCRGQRIYFRYLKNLNYRDDAVEPVKSEAIIH